MYSDADVSLILATFFHLALSNISNMESFTEIKIGIIDNEELREHKEFTEIIESVPDLFNVTYVSGQMLTSLEDGTVEGYIHFEKWPEAVCEESESMRR